MDMLAKIEGPRWAIVDSFKTAKNKMGLDHNEIRSRQGWHRHVLTLMVPAALMAIIHDNTNIVLPQKYFEGLSGPLNAVNPLVDTVSPTHSQHTGLIKSPSSLPDHMIKLVTPTSISRHNGSPIDKTQIARSNTVRAARSTIKLAQCFRRSQTTVHHATDTADTSSGTSYSFNACVAA